MAKQDIPYMLRNLIIHDDEQTRIADWDISDMEEDMQLVIQTLVRYEMYDEAILVWCRYFMPSDEGEIEQLIDAWLKDWQDEDQVVDVTKTQLLDLATTIRLAFYR